MNARYLRLSASCALMLGAIVAGSQLVRAGGDQLIVTNAGPYKLTGNSPLNYLGSAHIYDTSAHRLYSSTRGGVRQFDTTAMRQVALTESVRGVGSIALDASRHELYVLAFHDNSMSVVDTTTQKTVRTFEAPAWFNVIYSQNRGELYYMRGDRSEVTVADRQTGRTITSFALAGRPSFVLEDAPHHRILVRLASQGAIQIIDTNERRVVASWKARDDGQLSAMALNADGSRIFVSSGLDVAMIDGSTGKELSKFSTGGPVTSIVFDPVTNLVAAVWNGINVNVAQVNGDTIQLQQSLTTGGTPIQEIFLDPSTHRIFGVGRTYEERMLMSGSEWGSAILTLSPTK